MTPATNRRKYALDEAIKLAIAIIGAVTGIIALGWRVRDEFRAFLRIGVEVEQTKNGWVSILTSIENNGNRRKMVSYAVLLVGPETERPVDSIRVLAKEARIDKNIEHTNDLENFVVSSIVCAEGRLLIPLPFYYSENITFADEAVTYRVPLDTEQLAKHTPISVRFFVFASPRLHRSTQDTFIID